MTKNKKITSKVIFGAIFIVALLTLLFTSIVSVNAGSGDGTGADPNERGQGKFFEIKGENGTRTAWNEFIKHQPAMSISYLEKVLDYRNQDGSFRSGSDYTKGFKRPDGTYEKLTESCKKSNYIWYYGSSDPNPWKSSDGKVTYRYGDFFSRGNGLNKVGFAPGAMLTAEARLEWEAYLNYDGARWNTGRVVVVCSGAYTSDRPDEPVPLQITADSKRVQYNGNYHSVTTDKITSGALKAGHTLSTTTNTSAKDEGKYPVNVTGVNITTSSGASVLSEYKITTEPGSLVIYAVPVIDVKRPVEETDSRCVNDRWEGLIRGPVWVDLVVNPTFEGENNKLTSQLVAGVDTQLGDFVDRGGFNSLRTLGDWNNWKSSFNNIKNYGNDRTPTLTLNSQNQDNFSIYGGVFTATRRYQDKWFNVQTCQPQTRYWIDDRVYRLDENEEEYLFEDNSRWSSWSNDGDRLIISRTNDNGKGEDWHYQILSVNCNKEEFEAARAASNLSTTTSMVGTGIGGAMMTTSATRYIHQLPFGQTNKGNSALNRTGTLGFYTDGTSCKTVFNCTSTALTGESVEHDAKNNKVVAPSFDSEEGSAKVDANGDYLVFFRDNNDRKVRADVWYPTATVIPDFTIDPNKAAQNTYLEIDKNGTPEMGITTIAKWENIDGPIGGGIVNTDGKLTLDGSVNEFTMKSQWSSDENKPHKLGVDWRYLSTMTNRVPSSLNGFGITGTIDKVYTDKLNVYCEFLNTPGSSQAHIPSRPFVNSSEALNTIKPKRVDFKDVIRVLFTRSVSDTNE